MFCATHQILDCSVPFQYWADASAYADAVDVMRAAAAGTPRRRGSKQVHRRLMAIFQLDHFAQGIADLEVTLRLSPNELIKTKLKFAVPDVAVGFKKRRKALAETAMSC